MLFCVEWIARNIFARVIYSSIHPFSFPALIYWKQGKENKGLVSLPKRRNRLNSQKATRDSTFYFKKLDLPPLQQHKGKRIGLTSCKSFLITLSKSLIPKTLLGRWEEQRRGQIAGACFLFGILTGSEKRDENGTDNEETVTVNFAHLLSPWLILAQQWLIAKERVRWGDVKRGAQGNVLCAERARSSSAAVKLCALHQLHLGDLQISFA